MTHDRTNEAQQYAETIADEVRDLNLALSGGEEAREALERLEMIDRAEAEGDWFAVWMDEVALDVSVRVDVRGVDRGANVVVLRTVGGPRCEILWDKFDGALVEVVAFWGSDRGYVRLDVPNLAAHFEELVNVYSFAYESSV
jgi:hypothetical protein